MNVALRAVEVAVWLALFGVTFKPSIRLFFGKALRYDLVWFGVLLGTINRVLFNLVNVYMPESIAAREICHVYALVVAALMVCAVVGARRDERL